jgi:tripartite ATP-independent transporter DctP family solute receptor
MFTGLFRLKRGHKDVQHEWQPIDATNRVVNPPYPYRSETMKKTLLLSAALSMTAMFFAVGSQSAQAQSGNAAKPMIIKVAHVSQEGVPIDRAMHKLKDMLDAQTQGRIRLDVFPASALGGNRELLEQLQLGSLEMAISSVAFLGGFTDSTRLLDLPYLFQNNEAAEEILDGDVGKEIFAKLEDSDFIGLAWLDTGWRHLTANTEIRSPAQMKGKKIRVMDNQMHIDHFNALGASAIPMAFSEVFTALQNGTIDCQENPYANIQGNRLNEVQKHIIETGHIYDTSPLLASKIWWDQLSPADQKLIKDDLVEVLKWEREISLQDQDEIRKKFEANGRNVIVKLSPQERGAFRTAAQPVYEKYGPMIGLDLIGKVDEINKKYAR